MNMNRLRTSVAVMLLSLAALPATAESLTDALIDAYRDSGLIDQNRAVLRAADEDVAQAVATLRPVLNYAAGVNYADPSAGSDINASISLTAGMLLYDFGRSQLGVDVAKETVLATRAVLVDVENTVLLNTVTAYVAVRRSEAFVDLRQNNVRLLTEQLRATRDRFDVGEVTRTDVSLAEARLAAARSGLAAEQGGLAQAREQYRAVVGHYPGTLAPPPTPPAVPSSEEAARAIARQENPQVIQVQHQVKAADISVERASRNRLPNLEVSGRFGIDDEGDDSTSLGIQLSGPIYQGGALPSQERQSMARRDQVRAQLYTTGLLVDQQVGNAYANLAVAIASIDASDRQVRAAQLALEGVREELQLGARTTLEVLDQEQEVLDALTSRVAAEVDRYLAIYQILDAMGRLTAERLGLNVPIYDPAAYYNAVKDAPLHTISPQGQRLDRVLRSIGRN
jgi:outer membrane protein